MNKFFLTVIALLAISIGYSQNTDRPSQPDLPGDISIDFGLNTLYERLPIMRHKVWPSRSFGIYYQRTFMLSERFGVTPEVGIGNDRFGWKRDVNFLQDSLGVFSFDTLSIPSIKRNKFIMSYVEIPVELRFFPKKSKNGEGFFIGVGGILGYRIDSRTKIKYKDQDETRQVRESAGFGLNNFRYGIVGRVGWKPVNFYYKQYFSGLFDIGPYDTNPTMFTFGISFTGF